MHRLRLWLDRQLVVDSSAGQGLSPVNWLILTLIILSAILFTVGTEPTIATRYPLLLERVNVVILVIFAVEFCLRLLSAGETRGLKGIRQRSAYTGRLWLFIDFLAFGPELILMLLIAAGADFPVAMEWLKAIRLLRLLKLINFLPGGKLVAEVLAGVAPQLIVSLLAALSLVYFAAVLIYYVEGSSDPEHFGSVIRSLWWSVVTLTTVGYGDVYPQTVIGKVLAGMIAIMGVGIIALPSGIIAGAFMERLQSERAKQDGRRIRPKGDRET